MEEESVHWSIGLIVVIVTGLVFWRFVSGLFAHFIEPIYMSVTYKPVYVHFYPRARKLQFEQSRHLRAVPFFNRLDERRKSHFEHRVTCFLQNYDFHGRDGLLITDEMRISVASVYVMLTFGMRHYLIDGFKDILIYPDIYQSSITGEWHKGEFNPGHKVVVFSWKHFQEGIEANDNINLGIHEFAHVLHLNSLKNDTNSASLFINRFEVVLDELNQASNRKLLEDSGYFRNYAYTNQYEFLAVVLEHFFETPEEFRRHFPRLYKHISRMINYSV